MMRAIPRNTAAGKADVLQRRCACGRSTQDDQPCPSCRSTTLQRRALRIGVAGDRYEQEADRAADAVTRGLPAPALSSIGIAAPLQRDPNDKGQSPDQPGTEDKLKEAGKKLAEALSKTPLFEQLKLAAKQDPLVKAASGFVDTWQGKVVVLSLGGGAVAGLAAAHAELPMQIPEIPLDSIHPGMSVKIEWNGPVDKPTSASLSFSFTEQLKPAPGASKPPTAQQKELAALREQQAQRDAMMAQADARRPKTALEQQLDTAAQRVQTERMRAERFTDVSKYLKPGLGGAMQPQTPPSMFGDRFKLRLDDTPLLPPRQPSMLGEQFRLKLDERLLQRRATAHDAAPHADDAQAGAVEAAVAGSGQSLDAATRTDMEQRFGADFSGIRIHADAAAARSADAVQAEAYTLGSDIVFASGRYAPQSAEGRHLLAHELAHTLQQGAADTGPQGPGGAVPLQRQDRPAPPVVDPVEPDPRQRDLIDRARRAAAIRIQTAMFRTQGLHPTTGTQDRQRATQLARIKFDWDQPNMEQVADILRSMSGRAMGASIMVGGANDPECGSRAGYVRGNRPPIVLCPSFFDPATSDESRIRTLIHESAHASGIGSADSESYYPEVLCDMAGIFESADAWMHYVQCLSDQPQDHPVGSRP